MTDQDRPDPLAPTAASASDSEVPGSFGGPARPSDRDRAGSSVSFGGRTRRRADAVRAGMLVGTGLVVVLGAAVAMAASPAPAAVPGVGAAPSVAAGADPGNGKPGKGPRGGFGPFGAFGPFGEFGPGGPGGKGFGGKGFGGAGGGPARGFGRITVSAISGTSVSLATDDGWTRTISVTASTTITKGGAAATLADLAVGDIVRFAEQRNSDGTYAITKLEIVQPQVAGTVTAVDSASITISQRDGTSATVRTTGSTAYHIDDAGAARSDVTVGTTIVARGDRASDGSLTADSVWIELPRVVGTVTKTSADSLTLTRPDGTTVTIHVATGTTIRVAGVAAAKLSDIKAGMVVVAEGRQRADGSIDARAVAAGARGLGKGLGTGHGKGLVPEPDASDAPSSSSGTTG